MGLKPQVCDTCSRSVCAGASTNPKPCTLHRPGASKGLLQAWAQKSRLMLGNLPLRLADKTRAMMSSADIRASRLPRPPVNSGELM